MRHSRFVQLLLPVAAAAFLMFFALYNQYPIMAGDTAAYIESGFQGVIPVDRPIFYGLFLRLFSLGQSFWLPVFIQCFILGWLLLRFLRRWCPGISSSQSLGVILLISLATIGGWHASQLMPDVFTAILGLALLNYLFNEYGRVSRYVYLLLAIVSVMMHNSHLLLITVFSGVLLLIRLRNAGRYFPLRRVMTIAIMTPLLWLGYCTVSYSGGHGFTPSKASHVFLMGKLVESGVLKIYLDKNCDTRSYKICTYRDSLPPTAWEFVWDSPSPLYKTGGCGC